MHCLQDCRKTTFTRAIPRFADDSARCRHFTHLFASTRANIINSPIMLYLLWSKSALASSCACRRVGPCPVGSPAVDVCLLTHFRISPLSRYKTRVGQPMYMYSPQQVQRVGRSALPSGSRCIDIESIRSFFLAAFCLHSSAT